MRGVIHVKSLIAVAVWCLVAVSACAQEYVWLEGESPTAANLEVGSSGWGNTQFLSEASWLHVSIEEGQVGEKVPEGGGLLTYEFTPPAAGTYEVWNRIGFEFVRSVFDWRVDRGEWRRVSPDDLTSDLMEIAEWCEVAWLKLGEVDLTAGQHTLEVRLPVTTREENGEQKTNRILYASDAICLSKGAFRPNGKSRPDADWQTAADRAAADHVFQVRADPGPARTATSLAGDWQVCRYDEQEIVDRAGPTTTLPDAAQAYWTAIPVPSNKFESRPELRLCHRVVYRARVDVPASAAGRSLLLRFPSLNMIASLLVNGEFVGWTKAMFCRWDCDITRAVKPGQMNEVCLVIKDAYYAHNDKPVGSCRRSFNVPVAWMGSRNHVNQHFDFPVGTTAYAQQAGILEAPSLIIAGPVYTSDVFAKPSVRRSELGLEVTLTNSRAQPAAVQVQCTAVPVGGGEAKLFASHDLTVQPGEEQVATFSEPWADPKLWWPDEPNLYDLVTRVSVDGNVVDERHTRFGFREWDWTGTKFLCNGVPWQLWADVTLLNGGDDPEAALATWREHGQNLWRFWGTHFGGLDKEQTLDLMDEQGMVVRRSGIFDGQGANYLAGLADNKALFDNWIDQMEGWVREERNHPSILIWSLENEITFINSRNLGLSEKVEPEIARGGRAVMALDPTRPVMVDGGNCLRDNSLPVNGVHYMEAPWRDYPEEAYTLAKAYAAKDDRSLGVWTGPWELVKDRPIFMGESFYARGSTPSAFAQFGGEGCFSGWGEYTRLGVGRFAKMLSEGYRWHGVAAWHFWMTARETDLHYNSWRPVCVLCREWNWTFAGQSEITRTLKAFNNTHLGGPVEVGWTLNLDGRRVAGDSKTLQMQPGGAEELSITLAIPAVTQRTSGELILTTSRDGKEVFREVKRLAVIDPAAGPTPPVRGTGPVILDPEGSVKARLAARGIPFVEVAGPEDIPDGVQTVIIGKDALSPRDATAPRWVALAAAGARILVLDQENPLRYLAVPADLSPTSYRGSIAFSENLTHPAFEGLEQQDLSVWSGDGIVYRNAYKKATHGAVSLAQCDESLGCSALCECPVNDGLLVLCQLAVGDKLATDPVAQRLFDNLAAYCAAYTPERRTTAVVMDEAGPAFRLLSASGPEFDRVGNVLAAISGGKHDIIVFDATAETLAALAEHSRDATAFMDRGGWLMAWGLTAEGLADFNRLVGVEHLLRPFELERVSLPAVRDPLLSGITVRDVSMESAEAIFPWAGDKYLVDDAFTHVVDLDDIAPFCEFAGAPAGDRAAARAAVADWPRNAVNGFTSADAWKLIHYMGTGNPRLTLDLPREETLTHFAVILNTHYAVPRKVNLYFDDSTDPVVLTTVPGGERQDFDIAPRSARRLTVELTDFDKTAEVCGIDNLWITVQRPADRRERVVPLLNIGGLVKYPVGKGGLVLNQLNVKDQEPVPDNVQKKRTIATGLLRNLHAVFSGGKVLTTADLAFEPLALDTQCNQYLTGDRGWFEGGRDLAALPHGEVTLEGIPYVIRDFKTSPVFSCVMLRGPGARGNLPEAVEGLAVGAKAEVLYFLHTMNRGDNWRPRDEGDGPPVMFRYVIHYADGQTAEAPVIYGRGAGHWVSAQPAGLPEASVAWVGPFPGETTDEQAVLYQMRWQNPRPETPIATVDLVYGPEGSRWGTPALIAMTAATSR